MIAATLAHANTLTRDAVTQQLEWDSEFDASALDITTVLTPALVSLGGPS